METQRNMNEKKYISVKEWDEADQPREKLISLGKKQLSNAELIAILLRTGVTGHSSVELAKDVLAMASNSLTNLSRADFKQLQSIHGMALAKSTTLMAALELGWRMQSEINTSNEVVIRDSITLFNYINSKIVDIDHEEFWAVYLNARGKVVGCQRISSGGITETNVDPRLVFRGALEAKAVSFMVAHNHPSGRLAASRDDRELTQRLNDAGKLLQIKLLEHLIIAITPNGKADFYSFHDNGLI